MHTQACCTLCVRKEIFDNTHIRAYTCANNETTNYSNTDYACTLKSPDTHPYAQAHTTSTSIWDRLHWHAESYADHVTDQRVDDSFSDDSFALLHTHQCRSNVCSA